MSEALLLLKTQLYNYFSLNELFHPQQKKQSTVAITAVGIITLLAFLSGYNALTAMALVNMGQQALIPTYMVSVSSFLTLIFTLLRSNGILLGSRDFEMLSALPIKTKKNHCQQVWLLIPAEFPVGDSLFCCLEGLCGRFIRRTNFEIFSFLYFILFFTILCVILPSESRAGHDTWLWFFWQPCSLCPSSCQQAHHQ